MSADFVAHMEDVLDLYAEPYDPQRPVICFDESSTQLLADTREPIPAKPGRPKREDYEYRREGTRNLFLFCEPLAGWRHVAVTQRRTTEDFAQQMRWLVDQAYPEVPVVRLVLDNLNTHRVASLYQTFPAPEARRIAKRLEFHFTPKHGSWLNMAEIEFSVFSRSCLSQRLPDEESLCREVHALELERNEAKACINWRFNILDARTKLQRLYPFQTKLDGLLVCSVVILFLFVFLVDALPIGFGETLTLMGVGMVIGVVQGQQKKAGVSVWDYPEETNAFPWRVLDAVLCHRADPFDSQ